MRIKLKYIGFNHGNPNFHKSDIITRFLKPTDMVVNDINEANIIIVGDYTTMEDIQLLNTFNGIKIQYIAEPVINIPYCKLAGIIYKARTCDYMIGCISTTPTCTKYPLYMLNPSLSFEYTFNSVNEYVRTCEIHNKRFCILINRHDMGNTRTPIYNALSKYGNIDCPGKLFNNCSNIELNKIGIPKYVNRYKFIICSENYGEDHPGYITEKIINACLSGAIPIYFGKLDLEDLKVFNINRILLLNSTNINMISEQVGELLRNPAAFEELYRQPVFMETAYDTIIDMNNNIMKFFDVLRNK